MMAVTERWKCSACRHPCYLTVESDVGWLRVEGGESSDPPVECPYSFADCRWERIDGDQPGNPKGGG